MLKQEVNIYKEIQRNTEAAMKAIDAVSDKVFDATGIRLEPEVRIW